MTVGRAIQRRRARRPLAPGRRSCDAGAPVRPILLAVVFGLLACRDGAAETAAVGEPCDRDVPCAGAAFCDVAPNYPIHECEEQGTCVAVSASCPQEGPPVCGCDGELYADACAAQAAGVATRGAIGCEPPAGKFGCGGEFCDVATQYCEYTFGGGVGDEYRCLPLACSGEAKGCDCLGDPPPCSDDPVVIARVCAVGEHGGTALTCGLP